jgi:hypothetical protein
MAELNAGYAMLSVALNEAFALRAKCQLVGARQQTAVAAELLNRLVERLLAALAALQEHARHLIFLPTVEPLNPDFFRGERAVQAAWWNALLHGSLLQNRLRVFHKLWTLRKTIAGLRDTFQAAANEIAEGMCVEPSARWELLEVLHYDLNTLLRETTVVLKSFLLALSTDEFKSFQQRLELLPRPLPQPGPDLNHART